MSHRLKRPCAKLRAELEAARALRKAERVIVELIAADNATLEEMEEAMRRARQLGGKRATP